MSRELKELSFFADPETDRLAQLVFDLAAQLHVERARRLGLETLLTRKGVVSEADIAALATDEAFLAKAREGLDDSLARLFTVLTEHGDRRAPLRPETKSVPRQAAMAGE
ncbi:hypothetical protein [Acuticoccus mangrovi]|uniref:Uncharacterized protein n=1 Tax=Acuticoccus mangrovi TaxID=2796142 RepID=A0A934MG45_9HYPH|nr:hypothetical protein [Acuticoccus mangrovi]MBJ3775585.1 hypothetical protein [Acuticoccus mangrovi]